jgi:putative glutamine amidotransferase
MTQGNFSDLRVGLSASFFHADPARNLFKGKTLAYLEQDLVQWVLRSGALPYLIPATPPGRPDVLDAYVRDLDALVLSGGADVAPQSYGETPLRPEWSGDRIRDLYEIELLQAFMKVGKPVLGVCRGHQLINVAFGGTMVQDIGTQLPNARVHRNWDIYEHNLHDVVVEPDSVLARELGGMTRIRTCSVHHQCIKALGRDLVVEATCAEDGVIEAIRYTGDRWVRGIQWHPEWHDPNDPVLVPGTPLLNAFLGAARENKERKP